MTAQDQFGDDSNEQPCGGWPMILSGMKNVAGYRGERLPTPGSLMYACSGGPAA